MENRQAIKEVVIRDKKYQINKIDARTSCWLFSFLGSRTERGGAILSGLGKCSIAEFDEIHSLALKQVFWLDNQLGNTFPTSVITPSGTFTDPEVGADAGLVMQLMSESLMFQLSPFLVDRESNSPVPQT